MNESMNEIFEFGYIWYAMSELKKGVIFFVQLSTNNIVFPADKECVSKSWHP